MLVESEDADWGAGKTDSGSDGNFSADWQIADLILSSLAGSGLDIVTFNNQLKVIIQKVKDTNNIQQ